jgi:hypothetical protein
MELVEICYYQLLYSKAAILLSPLNNVEKKPKRALRTGSHVLPPIDL